MWPVLLRYQRRCGHESRSEHNTLAYGAHFRPDVDIMTGHKPKCQKTFPKKCFPPGWSFSIPSTAENPSIFRRIAIPKLHASGIIALAGLHQLKHLCVANAEDFIQGGDSLKDFLYAVVEQGFHSAGASFAADFLSGCLGEGQFPQ